MKRSSSILSILGLYLLFSACASVDTILLTSEKFPPKTSADEVAVLDQKLARIIATSQSADEDRMRDKILARAETIGADAVVLGRSDVLESMMGPSPLYESTLGPAADSFSPYAGGWWSPFYYDPWSFVQGAADQIGRTDYLSGTAIRYMNGK
jgi:hypothetical protein